MSAKNENSKTKVAFVGPKKIHDALINMDENWDFQSPVETLSEFEDAIDSDDKENAKIASDTSIVIFFSKLFTDNDPNNGKDRFANDAILLAPYAAIIVLSTNDDEKNEIQQALQDKLEDLSNKSPEDYNMDVPFYFMSYQDPEATLSKALSSYVRSSQANKEAKDNILNSLPDSVKADLVEKADEDSSFDENPYEDGEESDFADDIVQIPEAEENAKGKVITVTSSKGGSGKSTISMLLGTYLAKGSAIAAQQGKTDHPLKVLIFDFDIRDGQLGFLNGEQEPTIIDIVANGNPTKESIKDGIYHSDEMGVDFIFSSKRPRYAAQIPNEFFAEVVQKLREMYDYIILDTSVNYLDPLLDSVAYPIADKIVFVTDIGISSIFGMVRWIKETTQSDAENHTNINPDKIGIVVNKVLKDVNMDIQKIQQAAGNVQIYSLLPSMPGLITYAANTSTLDQVLNQPIINNAIYSLTESLLANDENNISQIPSIK